MANTVISTEQLHIHISEHLTTAVMLLDAQLTVHKAAPRAEEQLAVRNAAPRAEDARGGMRAVAKVRGRGPEFPSLYSAEFDKDDRARSTVRPGRRH